MRVRSVSRRTRVVKRMVRVDVDMVGVSRYFVGDWVVIFQCRLRVCIDGTGEVVWSSRVVSYSARLGQVMVRCTEYMGIQGRFMSSNS